MEGGLPEHDELAHLETVKQMRENKASEELKELSDKISQLRKENSELAANLASAQHAFNEQADLLCRNMMDANHAKRGWQDTIDTANRHRGEFEAKVKAVEEQLHNLRQDSALLVATVERKYPQALGNEGLEGEDKNMKELMDKLR